MYHVIMLDEEHIVFQSQHFQDAVSDNVTNAVQAFEEFRKAEK